TYRRILANEADGGVVILAVGPLRNIADLQKSKPDDASPLDGSALVAKKVKRLEIMGGMYPPQGNLHEGEWNFKQDPESAALVCSTWPTPILFNGEGGSTNSGRRVTFEMPEHNPLTMAYRHYPGAGFAGDRLSWDSVSALVAVRGPAPWYKLIEGGANVVDARTGANTWKADGNRGHSYLVLKSPKGQLEQALEDLQTAGQARPTSLKFNTGYYADAGMDFITSQRSDDPSSSAVKAFDRDEKSAWLDKAASSWIQCQYADGRKYRATSYTVVCSDKDRLPATLKLSGSNDGISWTELDAQSDLDFDERTPRCEFALANTTKWNRFRLAVTAKDGQEGVRVATVELNEMIDCQPGTAVTELALDREQLTLAVHTRATLNAMLSPLNSFEREVIWVSSDPAVAEVRKIGEQVAIVVGKKPGKCTMTANVANVKHFCSVTVTTSTLPLGWNYDELNTPAIPGSIDVRDGSFTLTGCGHAMTSWWERIRDQGIFVSKPVSGDFELSARLDSL
ncbi:MAG: nucleoside hydrolase, partial [Planctomycetaceae bacterium]|nr:nucleoside hydrolase [Planctomycetaceae bacterium]